MNEFKFKIGDKVRPKEKMDSYQGAKGNNRGLTIEDVLTISDIRIDSCFRRQGTIYGFAEDTNDNGKAHWLNVEKNFVRTDVTNWKNEMEGKNGI